MYKRQVSDFIDDFRRPDGLVVVDPVLGDNGRLYANFHESMIDEDVYKRQVYNITREILDGLNARYSSPVKK